MIYVVAGVLVQDGRVLLQQRPKGKDYSYQWECPGGKTDGVESHHGTIRRELLEELGLKVGDISEGSLWAGEVGSENHGLVHICFYRVHSWAGPIVPAEGQGWGWFTRPELLALWTTPGNNLARESICRSVWGWNRRVAGEL